MTYVRLGCSVSDCDGKHKGLGFCRLHWDRFKKTGSTDAPVRRRCQVEGCENKHFGNDWCHVHWKRVRKTGSPDGVKPRACAWCKKEFTPHQKQPNAAACSVLCSNRIQYAKRKAATPSRKCEACGAMFAPLLPSIRFCSKNCSAPVVAESRRKTFACRDCGVQFESTGPSAKSCVECAKERFRVKARTRNKLLRYIKRGARGQPHTKADWDRLVNRYRGLCAYCGERPYQHKDHVIPIARGGTDSIGNVLPACKPCNLAKGSKLLIEWKWSKSNGRKASVAQPLKGGDGK